MTSGGLITVGKMSDMPMQGSPPVEFYDIKEEEQLEMATTTNSNFRSTIALNMRFNDKALPDYLNG